MSSSALYHHFVDSKCGWFATFSTICFSSIFEIFVGLSFLSSSLLCSFCLGGGLLICFFLSLSSSVILFLLQSFGLIGCCFLSCCFFIFSLFKSSLSISLVRGFFTHVFFGIIDLFLSKIYGSSSSFRELLMEHDD